MLNEVFFGDDVDGALECPEDHAVDHRRPASNRGLLLTAGRAMVRAGAARPTRFATGSAMRCDLQHRPPARARAQRRALPASAQPARRPPLRRAGRGARARLLRRPAGHDGLDVAAQLAAAGRAALHRARQLCAISAATRASGRRCASPLYYTVVVTIAIFAVAFPLALFVERPRPLTRLLPHGLLPAGRRRLRLGEPALGLALNVDAGLFSPRAYRLGLTDEAGQPARQLRQPPSGRSSSWSSGRSPAST